MEASRQGRIRLMGSGSATHSTPRVRLAPLVIEHLPFVMTWVNDREVMQYFALRQEHISEDEERGYLATLLASRSDRAFSIFEARDATDPPDESQPDDDDEASYIGQCSVNQIYWPARNGRVFLVVRKEKQGGGRGAAALDALVHRAFGELDLHKLWLIVRRDNRRAQAMYLRAGFEFEGVLRDEYCVGDRYFDMVRMGIVRDAAARRG
jgi:RimJ/RimL family protein N-acetyltransferase